ncbi:hypothetical protein FOL47_002640 [Perkinsus chesapeaki]|uniref:Uncharacterized protein n=1 Tax=Perkinsus chesapeaki TaxID=330153 RepID=A0A7J6ME38_PERCH|nr:hypothetical protein FOL47_002640 [Perkinsus chesapeaki]
MSSSPSHPSVSHHGTSKTESSPRAAAAGGGGATKPSNAVIAAATELLSSSSAFDSVTTSGGSAAMKGLNSWPEAIEPPIGYEHISSSKEDDDRSEAGSNKRKKIRLGNDGRAKLRRKISSIIRESRDVRKARQEVGLIRSATVGQLVGMADRLGLSDYVDEVIEEQEQFRLNKPKASKRPRSTPQWYDHSTGSMSSSGFSTSVGSSLSSVGVTSSIGSSTTGSGAGHLPSTRTGQQLQLGNKGRSLLRQRISALTRGNAELKKVCREISVIRSATVQQLIAMADAVGLNDYVDLLADDYNTSKKAANRNSVERQASDAA